MYDIINNLLLMSYQSFTKNYLRNKGVKHSKQKPQMNIAGKESLPLCSCFDCSKHLAHETFERNLGLRVAGKHCLNCWLHLRYKIGLLQIKILQVHLRSMIDCI